MDRIKRISVRCEYNLLTQSTQFRNGAIYQAVQCFEGARVYDIIDDLGIVRTIIPDEPCPHLTPTPLGAPYRSRDLGKFVTVEQSA